MLRSFAAGLFLATISVNMAAQEIKSPDGFLGYELGTRFTFHHDVTGYFRYVADASSNAVWLPYGETYEGRPLGVCFVSSPENLANLEQIRIANLQHTGLKEGSSKAEPVPFVWLAYNVHGAEPAGTETAMKVLHALVTGNYPGADEWLKNCIIIIDPCQNPDGRDLFTMRYLRAQGYPANVDPNAWEHNQGWPSARLNHYLFDLNRDWSWQVQQETQMRMKLYNDYMPQVHADFHEMGISSTFFFPPGADPWHEVITPWQHEYHKLAGEASAKLFDEKERLYFTKDNFDLFCPSFGDTWPLFNGAMGFTLEQGGGGQAGLAIKPDKLDTLTLKHRIEGHVLASMAMVKTANDNRVKLLKEFYEFFKSAESKPSFKYKTVIIKGSNDPSALKSLTELLDRNQIRYSTLQTNGRKLAVFDYRANKEGSVTPEKTDIIINAAQPQGRLMQVLFEPDSYSADSLSYDLTAWSLPYVYNIEAYAVTDKVPVETAGAAPENPSAPEPAIDKPYAYAAEMKGFNELKFIAQLYKSGLRVRYALKPFTIGGRSYDRGSVVVARGDNGDSGGFDQKVKAAAQASNAELISLTTGLSSQGKDLGSDYLPLGNPPSVILAGGEGTSSVFGEIWFFLERELEYPVTVTAADDLSATDLSEYDILILPGGSYTKAKDQIMAFVNKGGRVIAIESAMALFQAEKTTALGKAAEAKEAEDKKNIKVNTADTALLTRYEDQRRNTATERSAGAIFRVHLDDTHPYAFGMGKEWFLMKRSTGFPFLEKASNIGYITDNKPVAGFAGYKFCSKVRNTDVIASERIGKGEVVYLSDDPYFRAYWNSGRVLLGNLILR